MIQVNQQFERQVRSFMRHNFRDYVDDCGEGVDMTAIAEAAQHEFGIDPAVDTAADEFTFEAAFEISEWVDEHWEEITF